MLGEREIKKAIRPFRFLLSPSRVLTKINGVPALECSQRVANEFYTRDIRVSPSYPPIPLSRGSILSVPRTGKKWNDNEIIEVYIHNRVCFDGHPDDGRGVERKKKICIHYSQGGRRFFFFPPRFTVASSVSENERDTRRRLGCQSEA